MSLPRHTGLDPVSPPVRAKIVSEASDDITFPPPLSATSDFILERSGDFRRLPISSGSVRGAFRDCGFYPEAFVELSATADFVLKRSGDFPQLRISSGSVQETFRGCGFRLRAFRRLSAIAVFILIVIHVIIFQIFA